MKTILVVEDEEILREIFQDELTDAGYNIVLAKNGAECVDQLTKLQGQVDLMILDIKLPDTSGLNLLGKVRNLFTHKIPVMMCTAYDMLEDDYEIFTAKKMGQLIDFIYKPVDLEKLRNKVKKAVG